MSKYVIEIEEKPLCVFDKDTQTFFPRLWRVKGFNSLVLDEEGLSRLEELNSDYINEHFSDLQDTAYQKGFEDGRWKSEDGCTGCKYEGKTGEHLPCDYCMNNFKNQWTEKKEEIGVGDVVERYLNGKLDSTGIYLGEDGDYWNCLFWTGAVFGTFAYPKNQFKKTEKHVDIASILEDMKHD